MMKTFYLLALPALMLAMSCSCERNGNDDSGPKPPINAYDKAENVSVRIVSYNVGAFGKYVENSTAMVASMMKEIKADAMILNELDRKDVYECIGSYLSGIAQRYDHE